VDPVGVEPPCPGVEVEGDVELHAVTSPLGTARATAIPHSAARLLTRLSVFTTVPPWWWVSGFTSQHYANWSAKVHREHQCTANAQVLCEHQIVTGKGDGDLGQTGSRRSFADGPRGRVESAPVERAGDDSTGGRIDERAHVRAGGVESAELTRSRLYDQQLGVAGHVHQHATAEGNRGGGRHAVPWPGGPHTTRLARSRLATGAQSGDEPTQQH
jgi:hypothetical protein